MPDNPLADRGSRYTPGPRSMPGPIMAHRPAGAIVNYDEDGDGRIDDDKTGALSKAYMDAFETPLQPVGVSGGTAAFFFVKYKAGFEKRELSPVTGKPVGSRDFWIGKDFARAQDEVDFYETAKLFMGLPGWEVLNWMTPYGGILKAPCFEGEGNPLSERDIILLRNARDEYACPRLLDVKVGEVTAVSGWQGKSAFQAWTQKWLDGATNSAGQGFRLEGFDNPPASMQSILNHAESERHVVASHTLHRFLLQRQPAKEFLKYFLDLHMSTAQQESFRPSGAPISKWMAGAAKTAAPRRAAVASSAQASLSVLETEELLLLQCIEDLAGLVAACRAAPIPQQWIGSSVMLTFDSERRPSRLDFAAEKLRPGAAALIARARVHVFDWGRSELNTPDRHEALSPDDRFERDKHWGFYCGGLAMLLFDCCLIYVRRYIGRPRTVVLSAWDRDVYTEDDLVGMYMVPIDEVEDAPGSIKPRSRSQKRDVRQEVMLEDTAGNVTTAGFLTEVTKLSFTLETLPLPQPTRMADAWMLTVHSLKDCPKLDLTSPSDPVVHLQTFLEERPEVSAALVARGKGGQDKPGTARALLKVAARSTTVATDEPNPNFEEQFEMGWLKAEARVPFLAALAVAMPGFQQTDAAASAVGGCSVPQGLPDFIDRTETEGGTEGSVHDDDRAGSSDDVESGKAAAGLEGRQAARSFSARGAVGRRYRFSQLFPATISEGLGMDDLERERLFLRHCFPELAAQGLLIDPSRTGIRTTNEKICLAVTVLIVVLCILAFGDYELFWADKNDDLGM